VGEAVEAPDVAARAGVAAERRFWIGLFALACGTTAMPRGDVIEHSVAANALFYGMPAPPEQGTAWTAPEGTPAHAIAALELLSALPDPRGCEHRAVTITVGSVWSARGRDLEVDAWVLPGGTHAIAFNGLVYPIVERAPLVWIWMGDPGLAEPATIPDHHWLASPGYAAYGGYLHCKSNYIRLHENVLDLTHFPFVHGEATGGDDYISVPAEVVAEGDSVSITRCLRDRPVNAGYGGLIRNLGHRVNRTSESWFKTPAFHIAHAKIEDLEGGVEGRTDFNFKIIHCFTPETAHTSHYFFCNARDVRIDEPELNVASLERTRKTFLEDDEALALVEEMWINEDSSDYQELSVRGDRAGLLMRRVIARRAAAERGVVVSAARRVAPASVDDALAEAN
jgi:vanillate O-demethylase monooxygenase subunit